MKVQESREALAPHALRRSGSHAHACDIDSPTRRSRMADDQNAWPVPPPTTVAISTACLMSHRDTPHRTSLALTTPNHRLAQLPNHPRHFEPNTDGANDAGGERLQRTTGNLRMHRAPRHRPIGVLPTVITHPMRLHPAPVLRNERTVAPPLGGNTRPQQARASSSP
jgi:hypothetical protein